MKNLHRFIVLLMALFIGAHLKAQAPPGGGCFLLKASQEVAAPGETVCVDVSAKGFADMVSMQFTLEWDAAKLQFQNLETGNNPLHLIIGTNVVLHQSSGKMLLAWTSAGLGVTVANDETMFSLCFKAIGANGQNAQVRFSGSSVPFEAANDAGQFMPLNQVPGNVRIGGAASASTLSLSSVCAAPSGCSGQSGFVDVTPTGGTPPYQFYWTGNFGFAATTEDLSNISPGVYFLNLTDATGAVVKAQFTVQPSSQGSTIFDADISAANCPATDGAIDLSVATFAPPLQYVWSNGATTQDLAGLAAGTYGVTVIDAQGCVTFREFSVAEASGISVVPNVESPDCDGSPALGSISISVSGGAAPYAFAWSNNWTTPNLSDLPPGHYTLEVTDANGCRFSETYFVEDFTTQAWDVATINYCKPDSSGDIVALVYDAPGIEPPVTYSWSNGVTHVRGLSLGSFAYRDTLFGVPSGQYGLTVTDAQGCSKTVNVILDCQTPVTGSQCYALEIGNAQANPGDLVCLPVRTKGFQDILSQQFTMTWDTAALIFVEVKNLTGLPSLTLNNFNTLDNGAGKLAHSWFDPLVAGVDLPDETAIFEVCFLVRPDAPGDSAEVRFGNVPVPIEVSNGLGIVQNFVGTDGQISWGNAPTPLKIGACTVPPDCANDGKASLHLFVDGSIMPYKVAWEKNGQTTIGQASDLLTLDPGLYRITVTDLTGLSGKGMFNFPKLVDSECVWPGDADNNNAVNHFDLLYMGLGFGKTGPARDLPGLTAWAGQSGADWPQTTPQRSVNFKNLDADGDGQIALADTLVIAKNWSSVIRPIYDSPDAAPFAGSDPANGALLFVPADTLFEGETGNLPVHFGTAAQPMTDLYGVAFSINYDPKTLKEGQTRFAPVASWLGAPNELLVVQRDFHSKGRLDVAVVRRDGLPISTGFGPIGSLFIVIEDDIFSFKNDPSGAEWTAIDTLTPTHFAIDRVRAINATEQSRAVAPQETVMQIRQKIVGTKQPNDFSALVQLSPNPADERLRVSVPGEQIEQIEVISAAGFSVKKLAGLGAQSGVLQTDDLPSGTYFLKILTRNGAAARQFAVLHP